MAIDVARVRLGDVQLGGYDMRIMRGADGSGAYSSKPAQRFGQKISVGPLKYQDFNPYESGFSLSTINAGYGLQSYSDLSNPEISTCFYNEGSNVDASEIYPVLSPPITPEYLPFPEIAAYVINSGPITFMGEWTVSGTTYFTAVAGNFVFTRNSDGSWTNRFRFNEAAPPFSAKVPVRGAVAIFNNKLIVGFGAAYTAVYCNGFGVSGDCTDGSNPIYIFAITADRASVYAAANATATVGNEVISSTDGITYGGTPVVCGDPGVFINALAPGGGLCTVFTGKPTEMGWITSSSSPFYQKLMDYDTSNAHNSLGMRLYQGNPHDEQNGATVVCVPRDRDLYQFAPDSQTSGQATNVSPWAQSIDDPLPRTVINPENVKGLFTAIQGTARFLYACVQNLDTGQNYIIRRDSRSGGWHTFLDLGPYVCNVMGVTSIFDPEPMLIIGYSLNGGGAGSQIGVASIPLDGNSYALTGSLIYSRIDYLFPNEPKLFIAVEVSAFLETAAASIDVYQSVEDGDYALMGTVSGVGVINTDFEFPADTSGRWCTIKLVLNTTDQTVTPQVRAVLVRGTVVPALYRVIEFSAITPEGSTAMMSDNLDNSHTNIEAFWDMVADATSQTFIDNWGDSWIVRVLDFQTTEVYREVGRTPETQMHFVLLTLKNGGGDELWDAELALWDADWALWGDES